MLRPLRDLSRAAALALAGTCCAQNVYIVDRLGRPGAHFTDLPAAEAAAQHGDTLMLRSDASPYTTVATSKALTIVGDPSGIAGFSGSPAGFRVTGIPAGKDFVMRNCEIFNVSPFTGPLIRVQACLGRVHLQQVRAYLYTGSPAVEVIACTAVTLREFDVLGAPALFARNSTLALADSRFIGSTASALSAVPAGSGLGLVDSTAFLSNVQAQGGLADRTLPPAPSMTLVGASVSVTGIALTARLSAGFYGSSGLTTAVPAVVATSAFVRLDPAVIVEPRGGAPGFLGVIPVMTPLATLSCTGRTNFFVAVTGTSGSVQALLLGKPGDPIAIGGIEGRLWLDANLLVALPGGLTGFSELGLPSGLTFAMQVATWNVGAFDFSVPAVVTNRR